jgi:CBS domain containing-hemolysin-like protein
MAFFSGIEIAFISANRLGIELKKKQGRSSGLIMSRLMEQPSKFLGSNLIGFNFFLIIYGLLVSALIKTSFWIPVVHTENPYLKLVLDIAVIWLVVIFFGELYPKAIFKAKSDSLLGFFAPLSDFFHDIFSPVVIAFVNFSESILKYLFNVRIRNTDEPFSMIDLEHFLQQTNEQSENNQEMNRELLQNALSLPAVRIRQCLVPRTEIEAVDIQSTVKDVRKKLEETKLSKIIVYDGNIDNIAGYVHQLDLFKKPENIQSVVHPIPVVPESMSATDLINKLSRERKSIAWVIDEFGGTAGIITMEDVLEEIFGDIKDEYDIEEFVEKQISENEYIFSGRLELDYLNEKYDLDFPESEYETLSGYIINEHETIPKPKERIIIDKYEFDALNVSDTRIEMVKMKVLR